MSAAAGGYIEGPGTGRSDSVKAGIFQNGQKVQEARLSDGEFVMTEKAVRNAGGGDREKGAARMYSLMNNLEKESLNGRTDSTNKIPSYPNIKRNI